MNKIISINLCSIIFQIDEVAYETLKKYLAEIKAHLGYQDGASEIYQDVENRIAELFQQKINDGKQAILPQDVEEVMAMMGKPEQFKEFTEENKSANTNQQHYYQQPPLSKRLFRNGDDKVLGGVCSGIAAYFNIDPIIVRLAFAAALFVFGGGTLLYIILWIALPKAVTAAEKMAMHGRPMSFDDLKKNVQTEGNQVKENFQRMGQEFQQNYKSNRSGVEQAIRIVVKVIALVALVFALMILLPIAFAFIVVLLVGGVVVPAVLGKFIAGPATAMLLIAALVMFFLVPVIAIFYKVIRLIFKSRAMNNWVKTFFTIVWVGSIVAISIIGSSVANDFDEDASNTETATLLPTNSSVMIIQSNNNSVYESATMVGFNSSDKDDYHHHKRFNVSLGRMKFKANFFNDTLIQTNVEVLLVPSADVQPHLQITKTAYGKSKEVAQQRLNHIAYNFSQTDSLITLPHNYNTMKEDLWRNQQVRLRLEIPVGKVISFDEMNPEFVNRKSFAKGSKPNDDNNFHQQWLMTKDGLVAHQN